MAVKIKAPAQPAAQAARPTNPNADAPAGATQDKVPAKLKKAKKDEAYYTGKYPHALPGTLQFDETANKQSMQIKCVTCGDTKRRVFTSDLFQVNKCLACAKAARVKVRKDTQAADAPKA